MNRLQIYLNFGFSKGSLLALILTYLSIYLLAFSPVDLFGQNFQFNCSTINSVNPHNSVNCVSPIDQLKIKSLIQANQLKTKPANFTASLMGYPQFDWPLEYTLADKNILIVNYVDDISSLADSIDYAGGVWTYNNHGGTDIDALSFRWSDRGIRVISAAAGTVIGVVNDQPDRNYSPFGSANYVLIDHGGGYYTLYYHLRRNSVTVKINEVIPAKTFLGFVASSGFSTSPHLHFEASESTTPGNYAFLRDPWNGSNNPLPSLWKSQEPYQGSTSLPVRIKDIGIYTKEAVGGTLGNEQPANDPNLSYLKERIQQPVSIPNGEPFRFWLRLQGPKDSTYKIVLSAPTVNFYTVLGTYSLNTLNNSGYYFFGDFKSNTGVFPLYVKAIAGGDSSQVTSVILGQPLIYPPRFKIAGKSFRLGANVIKDTLYTNVLTYGTAGPLVYSLINAPSGVTLSSNIVTIPVAGTQTGRSKYFQAVVRNTLTNLTDTLFYHLVDTLGIQDVPLPVTLKSFSAYKFDSKVNLDWETASEINNLGFELDRADSNLNWENFATYMSEVSLLGLGNSPNGRKYTFSTDYSESKKYFRLRSRDLDGLEHIYPFIRLNEKNSSAETFSLGDFYPNPFNQECKINLNLSSNGTVQVEIIDLMGRKVYQNSFSGIAGLNNFQLNLPSLSSGVYFSRFKFKNDLKTRKLILLK